MKLADIGIKIEEQLLADGIQYECISTDENDVVLAWNFVFEDTGGFLRVGDDEGAFKIQTVAIALNLQNITDCSRQELREFLEMNAALLNASFALAKLPVYPQNKAEESNSIFAEEGESITFDEDDEEHDGENSDAEWQDFLMIQTKLPLELFEPKDLSDIIKALLLQADMLLSEDRQREYDEEDDSYEDDEDFMEEFEERGFESQDKAINDILSLISEVDAKAQKNKKTSKSKAKSNKQPTTKKKTKTKKEAEPKTKTVKKKTASKK